MKLERAGGLVVAAGLCLLTAGCASESTTGNIEQVGDTVQRANLGDTTGEPRRFHDISPSPDEPDLPAPDDCAPGTGCFGEPCDGPDDCLSALCGEHMGDKVCTETCEESCPDGWSCALVTDGADASYICVSLFSRLCQPCATNGDCSSEETQNTCIQYPDQGSFCGGTCEASTSCPEGFDCEEVTGVDGGISTQCISTTGGCGCSETAIALSLSTPCEVSNDHGTCEGLRQCLPQGLSDCDAATPADEVCNGVDDDCDGNTDEGSCDDDNPCTMDTCKADTGCSHVPISDIPCEDDDACTHTDRCEDGGCVGVVVECSDGNPCTDDACDEVFGCSFPANGDPCDDGNPCTVGDHCATGSCTSGAEIQCEDGNPCTEDACDEELGCAHVPNTLPCDDGNACTTQDTCTDGACQSKGLLACDDQNPCTLDLCDVTTGCEHVNNNQPCDDEDACTLGDACSDGICTPGQAVQCDDSNPCTTDTCHVVLGCQHVDNSEPCDDLNPCTANDFCAGGSCLATEAPDCDDANPCTTDSCQPGAGCTHTPNAQGCDDSNPCTQGDHCAGTVCIGGETPLVCDDGNPCTTDSCDGAQGCVFAPNVAECDDQNACTTADQCTGGTCVGTTPPTCDDENPCTHDHCEPATGCVSSPNQAPCDDEDVCTQGDQCTGGACGPGLVPLTCDDGNPCTDDSCDPTAGCVFTPNDADCDDQNTCTVADQCAGGFCVGEGALDCDDQNPCTKDICLPGGGCDHQATAGFCSDADPCTEGDSCVEGSCESGSPRDCDDGNPCTDDTCQPDGTCSHIPNDAPCDDHNACSTGDHCAAGVCSSVGTLTCQDDNPCTTDVCDPTLGCDYQANTLPCTDSDTCTTEDTCTDGQCVGGPALTCEDGNPCTDDSCVPETGCLFEDNTIDCDDLNACTTGDLCVDGACLPGSLLDCGDQDPCTDTGCDPVTGCITDHNTAPCDDQNACTSGDTCDQGACSPGEPVSCDDGLFCNGEETCDIDAGCVLGEPPVVPDPFECTVDLCDEVTDEVLHLADDGLCPGGPGPCDAGACDPASGCGSVVVSDCCGNGVTEGDEDCDDGNGLDDDACTTQCEKVPLGVPGNPGASCQAILDDGSNVGSGEYTVDFDGEGPGEAQLVYCDMTDDGGGWTRMMGARWKHFFNDDNWYSHNAGSPLSQNYSILEQRTHLFNGGCGTWRLQVGNASTWEDLTQLGHFTVWEQCHDPFTESTDGSDYTFIGGVESITCGGFNGLHHAYQDYSYTSDPDVGDNTGCWWMQVVPNTDYNNSGYLEGYNGSGQYHQWQVLWLR